MKSILSILILMSLLFSILGAHFTTPVSAVTTWTVDDDGPADFSTIQAAIDAASSGDTIMVYEGLYAEGQINVTKSLNLMTSGKVTVDGLEKGHVFYVTADNVTIRGFEVKNSATGPYYKYPSGIFLRGVKNSRILENIVIHNYRGITVSGSGVNIVQSNIATNNTSSNILLLGSKGNIIENNTVAHSVRGIAVYTSDANIIRKNTAIENYVFPKDASGIGVELSNSDDNIIEENILNDNGWSGILIHSNVDRNIIRKNNATRNLTGIYLSGGWEPWVPIHRSTYNIVSGNIVTSNYWVGIKLRGSSINNTIADNTVTGNLRGLYVWGESNDNTFRNNLVENSSIAAVYLNASSGNLFYHNNFINNGKVWPFKQVEMQPGYESKNTWDDGYPSGGNYWSDYKGSDIYHGPYQNETGKDGFGDTPYTIDTNNIDHYPLMYQWPDLTPPTTIGYYDELWHTVDFEVTLTAVDPINGVKETYYTINDDSPKTVSADGQPLITTEGANNKLEYWSVDYAGNEEGHHILIGIKLDKTAPTGSILINNDATYTNSTSVTLTSTATDATSGVNQVRYSNDGVWDTEPWETPSPTKTWTLTSGDGTKTVYYQIKDNVGKISATYSDTIILDTAQPTGSIIINDGAVYTATTRVTLTLSATDTNSGVTEMCFSNDNATWSDWEPYATSKLWTLSTEDDVKSVYVQYRDKAGLVSSYSNSIILDTTKPTANAGDDQTVNQNKQVTFDASGSEDENGISTYTWTFLDIITQTLDGENPTYTFATPGTYTVTLRVTDSAGNPAADTVIITVRDATKPTANAGSDQGVNEGTLVTFDGSASTDNVGITSYIWTFTDVTLKTLIGEKPKYTFNTPGVYTITLNVTDAAGNWAPDAVILTVLDITEPIANAGQDQTVNVGALVNFDAGGSTDNVGIVRYEWNFGDGTAGTGRTTTHTYANSGNYTVTLTVKDAAGNTAIDSINITVLSAEASPSGISVEIMVVAVTIIIAIAAAATLLWKRRK